ncbi:MAG: dethiobiotin synthase [Bacillota bacterium]
MGQGIFVTGTDTDIGKTVITAGLVAALRQEGYDTGVMKPFQSGAIEGENELLAPDLEEVLAVTDLERTDYELMNPIRLKAPLAPSVAAKLAGEEIEIGEVESAYQQLQKEYQNLVVEGAGGLMVPLADDFLIPDLVKLLDLSIVIVARPNLGTINHTVLTVKMAENLGLEVAGIIINGLREDEMGVAEETNPEVIAELTDVPILGVVPYVPDLESDITAGDVGALVAEYVDLTVIKDYLA